MRSDCDRLFPALLPLVGLLACGDRTPPVGRLEIEPRQVRLNPTGCAMLHLDWLPSSPLEKRHGRTVVFVHLIKPPHPDHSLPRVARAFDHPLPREWKIGDRQRYEIQLCLSPSEPPLPPGTYGLSFGLYDEAWEYRWPLVIQGEEIDRREYRAATLTILPAGAEGRARP